MKTVVTFCCILLCYLCYNFRNEGIAAAFKVNFISRNVYSTHKCEKPKDLYRNKYSYVKLSSKTKSFSSASTSSYSSYISIPIYDKDTQT